MNFNLIDCDWIPVVPLDGGHPIERSIREVLLNGQSYKRVQDPSPLVVVSLHRLLLAILHRALRGPIDARDNAEWFMNGFDKPKLEQYLDNHKKGFELFDLKHPFFQVTGDFKAHKKKKTDPLSEKKPLDKSQEEATERLTWARLTPEVSSGNNKVLFNHTTDDSVGSVGPALAARLLVANQMFDVISSKTDFVNTKKAFGASPVYTLVIGDDVNQTLCLNLVPYDAQGYKSDVAFWEVPSSVTTKEMLAAAKLEKPIEGTVHFYTLRNRSIRLIQEDGVLANVTSTEYASGEFYKNSGNLIDPMVRVKVVGGKQNEVRLDTEKAFWRDFSCLVPHSSDGRRRIGEKVVEHAYEIKQYLPKAVRNRRIKVLVAGQVAGTSKVDMWRVEEYDLPEALMTNRAVQSLLDRALAHAEDVGETLRRVAFQMLVRLEPDLRNRELEGDKSIKYIWNGGRKKTKAQKDAALTNRLLNQVQALPVAHSYWSTLERKFNNWLVHLDSLSLEQAEVEWRRNVYGVAREAWAKTCLAVGQGLDTHRAISEAEYVPLFPYPNSQGKLSRRSFRGYLQSINPDRKLAKEEG